MSEIIKSPLNYTGGKSKLLPQILPLFPDDINTFVDIFCGGANVGINVNASRVIYNDNNSDLIGLYKVFQKNDFDTVRREIERIIREYDLSDSMEYGYSRYGCESGSGLGKYNKERYLKLRQDFNQKSRKDEEYYYLLFTLIIYGFNNQIRFNRKGEFNLPVGKRDFNSSIRKNLRRFIEALHNQDSEFLTKDFRQIRPDSLRSGDFVYCDPPYLITTASYNESNGWTPEDERDLLGYLDELDNNDIKFALSNVTHHKGRTNDLLLDWVAKYNKHILNFDYNNSNYHGKNTDKDTVEVLITNY